MGTLPTKSYIPTDSTNSNNLPIQKTTNNSITYEKIVAKIPQQYQGNVDAFVRDVRDLFGLMYWRYPPRSNERSVVLTLNRMFDNRLLVGLRGPRVSPRQISRGYQVVTPKEKKEVHVRGVRVRSARI